jgi:hypothetical protein
MKLVNENKKFPKILIEEYMEVGFKGYTSKVEKVLDKYLSNYFELDIKMIAREIEREIGLNE